MVLDYYNAFYVDKGNFGVKTKMYEYFLFKYSVIQHSSVVHSDIPVEVKVVEHLYMWWMW